MLQPDAEFLERFRKDCNTNILGPSQKDVERLRAKLLSFGFIFKEESGFEPQVGLTETFAQSILDDIIFRSVGKIAFNTLAYAMGEEFVLTSQFDTFRDYIRWGKTPSHTLGLARRSNLELGPDGPPTQNGGHTLFLTSSKAPGIICRVSLFDYLIYEFQLSADYPGVWYPWTAGWRFDVHSLTISEAIPSVVQTPQQVLLVNSDVCGYSPFVHAQSVS
jgi:hypothetical protein